LACTTDTCSTVGCTNAVAAGKCAIDGACYSNGQVNPNNPCQVCTYTKSKTAWSNVADATQCAAAACDGLMLSLPKQCSGGQCIGATQSCDDRLGCTTDSCSVSTGCGNLLQGGYCRIDGACYPDGGNNPSNPCQVCRVATSTSAWQLTAGTCFIDGSCYNDGEVNPLAPCQVCMSASSTAAWSTAANGTQCRAGSCGFQTYTTPKTCVSGQCTAGGTTSTCASTSCSVATCEDISGCSLQVQSGYCLVGGVCYSDGAVSQAAPCDICDSTKNQAGWSTAGNGLPCGLDAVCFDGACCARQCSGRTCGSDSCGGTCGTCASGTCIAGNCCIPNCAGKQCGDDGCQGDCGSCVKGLCSSGRCSCIADGSTCRNGSQCCGTSMCLDGTCRASCIASGIGNCTANTYDPRCCTHSCNNAGHCSPCISNGAFCLFDSECCSGNCDTLTHYCAVCRSTDSQCHYGSQCCSGLCKSNGRCAASSCLDGWGCQADADCCSGRCSGGLCN
jgi:hypothetical protein